jgi:hypothetical protein
MSRLFELQRAVQRSILTGDPKHAAMLVTADGLDPAARLRIHQHHLTITLTEALRAVYPVVHRLVGGRFFEHMAEEFCRAHPPTSPRLFEYGGAFAGFIEIHPRCRGVPYLADVARLEWAAAEALHAIDAVTAPTCNASIADALRHAPHELILIVSPSLRFVESPWPVDLIWTRHQPEHPDPGHIDLNSADPARLMVSRWDDTLVIERMASGDFAFRRALADGDKLIAAAERAFAADDAFDLPAAIRGLLSWDAIIRWRRANIAIDT